MEKLLQTGTTTVGLCCSENTFFLCSVEETKTPGKFLLVEHSTIKFWILEISHNPMPYCIKYVKAILNHGINCRRHNEKTAGAYAEHYFSGRCCKNYG